MRGRDLTQGDIRRTLINLALPIMATSLINMLYNITDMMWLGRLSKDAVAAAGTVGYFTSLAAGIMLIVQTGAGIGVAQAYGRKDQEGLSKYISNGLRLNLIFALAYCLFLFSFRKNLIGFFKIDNPRVVDSAIAYLEIIALGLVFQFFNPVFSSIFNGIGNSLTPFRINSVGLITNIILDPVLIFGLGPFPRLGIRGAALATSLAQLVVLVLFSLEIVRNREFFKGVKIFTRFDWPLVGKIVGLGFPGFLETTLRTSIGIVMLKILAGWGSTAMAVQSIGIQIESLSWMTAKGFASALTAFAGQNYGIGNISRVREGYRKGIRIVGTIGLAVGLVFIVFGAGIFSLFIPGDGVAIDMGANYLRILAYSQVFMCIEIATMGTFNGVGRPVIPSVISVVLNFFRIPLSLFLSAGPLGLDGIWWSISATSIFKGILSYPLCNYTLASLDGGDRPSKS